MKLVNFGLKLENLRDYVAQRLDFPVFIGKPSVVPNGIYCYFRLENNSEEIKNDNHGVYAKRATIDFIVASGNSSTPDIELYELLNKISEIFIFKDVKIADDFKIYSVQEEQQSGVMRDDNRNPMIIGVYSFIYRYFYD